MSCGPDIDCTTYTTPEPLLLEICCTTSYGDVRLQPGVYPMGTPLMIDPADPLATTVWDGVDPAAIQGWTHCDEDTSHLDCPCPTNVICGPACLNLKAICWPIQGTEDGEPVIDPDTNLPVSAVSDEVLAHLVAHGAPNGVKLKMPVGDCGEQPTPEEAEKILEGMAKAKAH